MQEPSIICKSCYVTIRKSRVADNPDTICPACGGYVYEQQRKTY